MNVVAVSKGLSLNDSYWVVEENSNDTFEKTNLYDNRLSAVLASIAFTGYGSNIRSSLISSPEFTTNGMLPKCWRRIGGKLCCTKVVQVVLQTQEKNPIQNTMPMKWQSV